MSITDIYNTLNDMDLGEKSMKRLAHIVLNNTDRSCFLNGGLSPIAEVSPVITGRLGTKQLTKAFKAIGIYNLVLDYYDAQLKVWHFSAFTNRCKLLRIQVKRSEFGKPITYEDAVAVALIRCKQQVAQMQVDQETHTAFIASEIELEPTNEIRNKVNELTDVVVGM